MLIMFFPANTERWAKCCDTLPGKSRNISALSLCKLLPVLSPTTNFYFWFNLFFIYFVYICSVLLYRSMECTVVLLPHWWCAFSRVIVACAREGGVKTKPCASRDLTRLAIFYNAKKKKTKHKQQQRTIKNVRNVPCEELTCHALINTWHLKSPFSFYTCEIILARTKCTCAQD